MCENRETLTLNFVLKNDHQTEEDAGSDMKDAFKSAVDFGMCCRWITEADCQLVNVESRGLVFIFEDFEGQIFSRFSKSHKYSRIIGPKCLLNCMSEGIPVPNTKYPVFNLAMNRLSICTSGVPPDQKKEIEKLVGYMGGTFCSKFLTTTTHLVVNSVLSEKCFKAREAGIPVLTKSWIEDVWRRNALANVEVTLNMMRDYEVPIFYNLKVTASGMLEKDKNEIRGRITDNGGVYTPEMRKETNVLVLPAGRGEKFRFAERWKIICLSPSWIECCVKKGYAVRYENYVIKSAEKKCSTPVNTCNNMVSLMNANDSDISVIPSDSAKTVVADTQNDSPPLMIRREVFKTPVKCAPRKDGRDGSPRVGDSVNYQALLNDTAVSDAKKCGPILDGCKVYLAGFKDNEAEKLRRILNYGGAIRYTELNDSVTHVIVGNPSKSDVEVIKTANHPLHVVTLKWLSSSIGKGALEKESNYAHFVDDKVDKPQTSKTSQQPSPLSKKGLQMLNPVRETCANSEPAIDHGLLEKYSRTLDPVPCEADPVAERSDAANREDHTRDQTTQGSTSCNLFAGLKFAIVEYESSAEDELKRIITEYGGSVCAELSSVDYIIVPLEQMRRITRSGVRAEVVTSVWIQECYEENRIVEIKYHHRPLIVARPMTASSSNHCVITFSSYSVYQRQYLEEVAKFLGVSFQNVLSKRDAPERDIAKTTHLVCALPEGVKYNAAKKWNLPIINERWLLDSFNQRRLLPFDSYLLRENQDHEAAESENNIQNSRTAAASEKATTSKQMPPEEAENSSSCRIEKQAKAGEQIKTIAARSSYTIPELTEAVKNTDDRAFSLSGKHKRTPESKDYPAHGLLARFNRHASSIMKRKSDDENDLMAAQTACQRRKVLRSEATRTMSSQEGGVGWQDTFTDAHSENLPSTSREPDRGPSSIQVPHDDIENDQRLLNENPTSSEDTAEDRRTRANQLFRNSRPALHNMMISVNNKEKKETCEAIVEGLGGKVIQRYDPDSKEDERVTHLIIDELKKTEKLLCSLASGSWVLHSSYLEQCKEKKEFLSEEPFEWGNPLRTSLPVIKESRDSTAIAKAAYRWRRLIQAEGPSRRPFINMRAVIVNSSKDEPMQSLIRVVKSGGGQVLPMSDVLKATHCLVLSVKNVDCIPVPLEQLARNKVHYLPAVYLSDCLIRDPPPTPESCYLDTYKCFF